MGSGVRVCGFRDSGLGTCRMLSLGFGVKGLGLGDKSFGFRVSGFRFRISVFGFLRVSVFGFRIPFKAMRGVRTPKNMRVQICFER